MSKLENFKYIDDLKIKNKYEITKLIEPGNILDNYYRNTLKDFTPDKATFAHEEARRNTDSVGKLNTHYYGRRNTTEPFQSDLFLGFTDKDPRSIHDGPLMGKYQEQIWKRKDDYKYSFKDDTDNRIHSSGISESKMIKNKKQSYDGFKNRYKNFEESNDAWTNSFNAIKSDKSKVTLHDVDDIIPDLVNVQDLSNRRDYISKISLDALPMGWNTVQDQKVKIAKYNHLFSQGNIKDINILKNKNEQEVDGKVHTLDTEQQLLKQLLLFTENLKNKKQSDFKNQETKYKDSKNEQIRKINKNREHMKNNEIVNTELDNKLNKLSDLFNNKLFSNKEYSILNEALHKSIKTNNENFLNKGNNKEQINQKNKLKDDIINELLFESVKSEKNNILEKGNNKEHFNNKSNIKILNNDNNMFLYNNNLINNDKLQQNNNKFEVFNYSNKMPEYSNNFDNVKTSLENKLNNYDIERFSQHRKPNNQSNDALHTDDFDYDGKFEESGQKDRRMGIHGSKYLFREKVLEPSMNSYNSINDSNSSIQRKYY